MKKIVIVLVFALASKYTPAQIFGKKQPKMEEHTSESVFAYLRPLSEFLPLTTLKIKVDGKDKEFKLVELTKRDGSTPLVYIPVELYEQIKPKLTATDEQWEKAQDENEYPGFELTASPLGEASIYTKEQMKSIEEAERRIAGTYRYQYKYIVWSVAYFKAKGYRDENGKFLPKKTTVTTNAVQQNNQVVDSTAAPKKRFRPGHY